jgi:hypothetical protein
MTRTSFQYDFDREVERQARENEGITQYAFNRPSTTQIAPATDEQIESLERALTERDISTAYSDHVLSLIARIKAEREQKEQALEALKPFAAAEELSRNQFGGKSVTLAVLLQVAHYFIEWPHLVRARALLTNKGEQP